MASLEWMLLEHVVRAGALAHVTTAAVAHPITTVLLLALAAALMLAVARAGRRLLRVILALVVRRDAPPAPRRDDRLRLPDHGPAPSGGMGPRAPGRRSRRPLSATV